MATLALRLDLHMSRKVSSEEGEALAQSLGIMFMETSAKARFNVKALFHSIALKLSTLEKNAPKPASEGTHCVIRSTRVMMLAVVPAALSPLLRATPPRPPRRIPRSHSRTH